MSRRRRKSGAVKFSLFVFQDIITCVMGIMLLLTLMLCLQIVANPGISDVNHDVKALANLTSASKGLQSDLETLQQAVADNATLLDSGALIDVNVLSDQKQQALNSNQRSERDLKKLAEQTQKAKEVANKLNEFAKHNTAVTKTKTLNTTIDDAQRILKELAQGRRVVYDRPPGSNECWLVEVSTNTDIRAGVIGKKQPPLSFPSIEHCRDWMLRMKSKADFLVVIKPATWDLKAPLEKVCQASNITYAFDLLPQDKSALDDKLGGGL